MTPGEKRFVLLRHDLAESRHWDLMLETEGVLATWQLLRDPFVEESWSPSRTLPARRLQDHRLAYLEYEGPVSRDRGHVTRVDAGTYFLLVRQPDLWTIRITGRIFIGTFLLSPGTGDWEVQRLD